MRIFRIGFGLLLLLVIGYRAGEKASGSKNQSPVGDKKPPVGDKNTAPLLGFSLVRMDDTPDRKILVFEMSETMVQFAGKLGTDDGFQLQFHQFWGKMADAYGFNVFGFHFSTDTPANSVPLQLHIEGSKTGNLPGYLQRTGDNPDAFDYILAQSTFVKKLKDPGGAMTVQRVEVTPLARSFSTPGGTRLVIPTGRYKTIVDFSRKASEAERKDFWGLVAKEMSEALAVGKFIKMGVHCGDLHGQTVGHFHYRLTML